MKKLLISAAVVGLVSSAAAPVLAHSAAAAPAAAGFSAGASAIDRSRWARAGDCDFQ